VSQSCLVLIAPAEHHAVLRTHAAARSGDVLVFADTEPLVALDAITTRRPATVVLEKVFAGTPRGSALIGRIKADPTLSQTEILVVAHGDQDGLAALRSGHPDAPPPAAAASASGATPPIDYRGTRRVPRVRMAEHVRVMVDGKTATLVDLSIAGAQVISSAVLRPNHRVRVVMADERGSVKCVALVAWASFEIPSKSEPRYRAGLQFIEVNPADVQAYCERHQHH